VNPQEQSGNCEGSEVRNAPEVKKQNKTKNLKKKKKKKGCYIHIGRFGRLTEDFGGESNI
jgi:hypothetical protein